MMSDGIFHAQRSHKTLIGMVHLPPLPSTPFHEDGTFHLAVECAVASALALDGAGMDGCLLQAADRVYPVTDEADPARIAGMAVITKAVRQAVRPDFRIGVQIMRNANCASVAIAKVCGGDFVRAATLVGATMSAQGLVQSEPDRVMRYRRSLDAQNVAVVADIASMHFAWFGGDKPVGEIARAASAAGASAVAISDNDRRRLVALVDEVRTAAPALPLLLAGGSDLSNAAELLSLVDGAFVGSAIETNGWGSAIDADKAAAYVALARLVR